MYLVDILNASQMYQLMDFPVNLKKRTQCSGLPDPNFTTAYDPCFNVASVCLVCCPALLRAAVSLQPESQRGADTLIKHKLITSFDRLCWPVPYEFFYNAIFQLAYLLPGCLP